MSFEKTGDEQPFIIIKKCSKCDRPSTTAICSDCSAKQRQQHMQEDEANDAQ